MGAFSTILLSVDADGIATLTFNRPEVRNAMNRAMVDEAHAALGELEARGDVRALVLTGAGDKAFVGGADIAELRERSRLDALRRINAALYRRVEQFPAPTIAAIRGFALGGGCELAIACDLRVAGRGAQLGQPEVGLGILPGAGATYRLPRLIGLGRAKDLVLTGRLVPADEALGMGLVNRVVDDAEVLATARALAGEIGKNSALAVRLAKASLNLAPELSIDAGMALESTAQAILFEDEEKRLRMQAFLERRGAKQSPPPAVVIGAPGAAERRLTLADLSALPAGQQVPDVGALVPGRKGRAVRVAALLGPASEAAPHAVVASSDGRFQAGLSRAQLEQALLVYALGGDPLPEDQGGPFRLLVPAGADACQNVKGVARITLQAASVPSTCPHTAEEHARMRGK